MWRRATQNHKAGIRYGQGENILELINFGKDHAYNLRGGVDRVGRGGVLVAVRDSASGRMNFRGKIETSTGRLSEAPGELESKLSTVDSSPPSEESFIESPPASSFQLRLMCVIITAPMQQMTYDKADNLRLTTCVS